MPKLKLGAVVYALVAVGWVVSAGAVFRGYGTYAAADRWYQVAISAVLLLTGVLFGVGAVTRRGLVSDDGPRICRQGWIVVLALVGAGIVVAFLGESEWGAPYPTASAIFIPGWIKRLQVKYYEGRAEAAVSSGEPRHES
ncbi:hypothetical protein ACQHIV_23320 [Kribbella sp. GL6]|uniref:hypothetical protein n=1 Tax=Kribbella sp. GL6 TaxID=3419765 RepID=UPI003CFC4BB1